MTVDLHTETAKLMFKTDKPTKEQRKLAKSLNYIKLYSVNNCNKATIRSLVGL